jgi:hypothetical protein
MLSDVVARRRLRASQSIIIQATRAARQKRIEFESLLVAYSFAKQQYLNSPASAANSALQSTPSSSSHHRNRRSRHLQFQSGQERVRSRSWRPRHVTSLNSNSNDDDLEDIIWEIHQAEQGLLNLEASSDRTRPLTTQSMFATPPPPPPAYRSNSSNNMNNNQLWSGSRDSVDDEDDLLSNLTSLLARDGLVTTPPRNTTTTATPTNNNTEGPLTAQDLAEWSRQQQQLLKLQATPGSTSTSNNNNNNSMNRSTTATAVADNHLSRIALRVEEEEQLNRAILMSLRDGPVLDNAGRVKDPTETNIQTIEQMGFDRQSAIDALRSTGDDLEAALERLINM